MIKKRLIQLLSKSKKYIFYIIFWQWLALLTQICIVFTISNLIEKVIYHQLTTHLLNTSLFVFIVMIVIRMFCDFMNGKCSFLASADVKQTLRNCIYEKVLRLGPSYNELIASSEIVQVSTEGVEQLETYFGKYLPQLFYSLLAPITLFIVLCRFSLKACIVLLLCVPLIPLSIVLVQKIAKKLLNKYWSIYTELGDSFLENLQGLTTLKIYQADAFKSVQMDQESQKFRKITMKVLTMQLNSTSVMDIVAYGGAAIGMIVALTEFLNGSISLSHTLCIILLASEFFLPLRLLGSYFHIAMNGMAASDKIFKILDLPEEKKGILDLTEQELNVSFKDVHFSYTNDKEVLKGIDLNMKYGTLTSIVGQSGCGKSTIASLLSAKYKNYKGCIQINNQALSDINESSLMRKVVLVRYNSHLFKGSVEENLKMANPDVSKQEMMDVLKKVNIYEFLQTQDGLQTQILENASNLSGGQKQRLVIARALLKKEASIYIFDEVTSNIDSESEAVIINLIYDLAKTKTVLLISHRLANVVRADQIYFLEDGNIIESGNHKELMEKNGFYKTLFEKQKALENYRTKEVLS